MRLIKLSAEDKAMGTRADVLAFFNRKLWLQSSLGKFDLTPSKSNMVGISPGTLLVFSYKTECLFIARTESGIIRNADPESPAYFVVDLGSIVAVSSALKDYEQALKKKGLSKKHLVRSRAWPKLSDACEAFTLQYFDYLALQRFIFVRVGWMQQYRGPLPGDDRPIGGGKYNQTETGHEVYNFFPFAAKLYGYYQPQMRADTTAIERIDYGARNKEALDGVTVVFVAKRPEGGQVIIGWYRNARVFRDVGPSNSRRPEKFPDYRCVASVRDSVLLPDKKRHFKIPSGRGGIGQANVCYSLTGRQRKKENWMFQAMSYVNDYEGENLLVEPTADASDTVAAELEAAVGGRTGQGFRACAKDRKVIEERGMKRATYYFKKQGFTVEDVSQKRSYDLHCWKGERELQVEVKATTTDGATIFLTRREAELAASPGGKAVLFVLHSVKLNGGVAKGGKERVLIPWRLSWEDAKAITYSYQPPSI